MQGLLYWKTGHDLQFHKEKAVEQFILAVKLDPSNGDAYRFLGNYYNLASRDKQRATRCYQKCVTLNPEDSEAGVCLCLIICTHAYFSPARLNLLFFQS
jgi:superkiller protein 3